MKKYTPEQTAKFIAERNSKRDEERNQRKNKTLVWNSKLSGKFIGSVKEDLIEKNIVAEKILSEDEKIEQSKNKQ